MQILEYLYILHIYIILFIFTYEQNVQICTTLLIFPTLSRFYVKQIYCCINCFTFSSMDSGTYNTDSSDNEDKQLNLLHLMHAIACAHSSTGATSLMHVKNSMHHFY